MFSNGLTNHIMSIVIIQIHVKSIVHLLTCIQNGKKLYNSAKKALKVILVVQEPKINEGALQEYRDSIFSDFLVIFLHDFEYGVTDHVI